MNPTTETRAPDEAEAIVDHADLKVLLGLGRFFVAWLDEAPSVRERLDFYHEDITRDDLQRIVDHYEGTIS